MAVLLSDGHLAGTVLEITNVSQAAVLEHTLMALAYESVKPAPRVLLLGERGTGNT